VSSVYIIYIFSNQRYFSLFELLPYRVFEVDRTVILLYKPVDKGRSTVPYCIILERQSEDLTRKTLQCSHSEKHWEMGHRSILVVGFSRRSGYKTVLSNEL
jgi:hypothetical protein